MNNKKLLLHTCCAPCVTVPIERLGSDYKISCFFYNPNIHPEEEYRHRLKEFQHFAEERNINVMVQEYDSERWFEMIRGLEKEPEGGERCTVCFKIRLQQTAKVAKQEGFDLFTTTLTISPHKNATLINQIGLKIGEQYQIEFLEANFKKKDGYLRSIELSNSYNLYRQNYCGCIYSQKEKQKLRGSS